MKETDFRFTLIESLKNSLRNDEWIFNEYTCKHAKSNIEIWTTNGFWHLRVYKPISLNIGFFDALDIWPLIQAHKAKKIREMITNL